MKLTKNTLKQIIQEELDDVVGGAIYDNVPSAHPMIKMADAVLLAAMTKKYSKIMRTARRFARAYAMEMTELGPHSKTSMFYDALQQFGRSLYNYEKTGGGLEQLIRAAENVKTVYIPDNERPLTDDDPDF